VRCVGNLGEHRLRAVVGLIKMETTNGAPLASTEQPHGGDGEVCAEGARIQAQPAYSASGTAGKRCLAPHMLCHALYPTKPRGFNQGVYVTSSLASRNSKCLRPVVPSARYLRRQRAVERRSLTLPV
jgi:hypothetical protein